MKMPSEKKPVTPEFAGTIFFAIYGILFFFFTKYTLIPLKGTLQLPIYPAFFIVLIVSAIIGRKFSRRIASESNWIKLMFNGFFMAIIAILIASISLFIRAILYDPAFFSTIHRWQDYFMIYGLIVLSIILVIGIWLIPMTGLAAIYFNKRFLPGLIAASKTDS